METVGTTRRGWRTDETWVEDTDPEPPISYLSSWFRKTSAPRGPYPSLPTVIDSPSTPHPDLEPDNRHPLPRPRYE